MDKFHFTSEVTREGDGYVSVCSELDVASQGTSVEEAKENLKEAVLLFFGHASETEIARRSVELL